MAIRFAPATFAVAYSVAYLAVFALDAPLFRYYPLHGNFNWGTKVLPGVGPAMAWYGLMASAFLISLVVAFLLPDRLSLKLVRNRIGIFPVVAMLGSVLLLRKLLF